MSLEQLPDELLVLLLQHLDAPDLLTCRLVCKRLKALALDPLVWRHRTLRDDKPWARAVLRLAPCLHRLSISSLMGESLPEDTPQAKFGVVELDLHTGSSTLKLKRATAVLRHQTALGRLKSVTLTVVPDDLPASYFDDQWEVLSFLLQTLVTTPGLHDLGVDIDLDWEHDDSVTVTPLPPSASLRRLYLHSVGIYIDYDDIEECLLHAHAATLEVVNVDFEVSTSALAAMPKLRKLTCPILEDMMELSTCQQLTEINLCLFADTVHSYVADNPDLLAFVTEAENIPNIRALTVTLDAFECAGPATCLILAMALSGRSRLESVTFTVDKFYDDSDTHPTHDWWHYGCQKLLLDGLPHLSFLRRLEVVAATEALLHDITPVSAPALRCLLVLRLKWTCTHAWLHRGAVRKLLATNPQLHLNLPQYCHAGVEGHRIPSCEAYCCLKCQNFEDFEHRRAGYFSHDPTVKCSTPEHRYPGASGLSWHHVNMQ